MISTCSSNLRTVEGCTEILFKAEIKKNFIAYRLKSNYCQNIYQ